MSCPSAGEVYCSSLAYMSGCRYEASQDEVLRLDYMPAQSAWPEGGSKTSTH